MHVHDHERSFSSFSSCSGSSHRSVMRPSLSCTRPSPTWTLIVRHGVTYLSARPVSGPSIHQLSPSASFPNTSVDAPNPANTIFTTSATTFQSQVRNLESWCCAGNPSPLTKRDDASHHVNMTNINHRDYKTSNLASNTRPDL